MRSAIPIADQSNRPRNSALLPGDGGNGHLPPPRRFTLAEYHFMGESGILSEDDRCELIHGIIREKPVIKPPHKKALRRLIRFLSPILNPHYVIDTQGPVTLFDSEPEPDYSAALPPESRYDDR
ncbi:MAG TPA: hypothetical protein VGL71_02245, partial [Urbifossiella sp.]